MARASHVCPSIGCFEIVPAGSQKYCDHCQREKSKRDNKRRNPENKKIYSKEWERIRKAHLQLFPYCAECGRLASHVDHIIPLKSGGNNDSINLQSLCINCHSRKTALQDGGFGNPKYNEKILSESGEGGEKC